MAFGGVRGTLQGAGGAIAASNNATGSVAISVGDLIVLHVAEINTATTATTASDNLGASYTTIRSGQGGAASNKTYYRYVSTAGTLTTITVLATASSNDFAITAAVFEGPFTSTPLDYNPASLASDITSPFTNTLSTGTLSQADELVVMTMTLNRGQTITTAVSPNLMAINVASGTGNAANSISSCIGYQVVASTTAVNPSFACASGTFTAASQLLCSFRKGAADTGTGSATTTSTVTGTSRVDIARAGSAAAVTTGTTGSSRSDIARAGSASAAATVSATGLATVPPLGLIARSSRVTGGTTPPIDTSGANLIMVGVSNGFGGSVSFSDNYGNTWGLDIFQGNKTVSPDVILRVYRVNSTTPLVGPGHTITVTGSSIYAIQFSAWRSEVPWTNMVAAVGKDALPHGTSGITTAALGDLVLAFASGNGTLTTVSQGTILDKVDSVPAQNWALGYAYFIQPSSPNVNVSWSGTGEAGVANYAIRGTWLDANASDGLASASGAAAAGGLATTDVTAVGTAFATSSASGISPVAANDTGAGTAAAYATATGVSPSGDNVLWTPGSGSTIATDDIGGVHYQWMKPVFGVDGVVTDVTNADPLPLQGFAKTITSSVTRPANTTAYGTNTAWSNSTSSPTVLTFTNVGRLVGGAVLLNSVQAKVYPGTQDINAELWLFDSVPTAINDGSNFNVSDAELESLVCRVSFAFGGLDTSMVMVNAIGALINHTSGSNSLYGLIRMLRAYTPVSGSKLTFRLQVTQVD